MYIKSVKSKTRMIRTQQDATITIREERHEQQPLIQRYKRQQDQEQEQQQQDTRRGGLKDGCTFSMICSGEGIPFHRHRRRRSYCCLFLRLLLYRIWFLFQLLFWLNSSIVFGSIPLRMTITVVMGMGAGGGGGCWAFVPQQQQQQQRHSSSSSASSSSSLSSSSVPLLLHHCQRTKKNRFHHSNEGSGFAVLTTQLSAATTTRGDSTTSSSTTTSTSSSSKRANTAATTTTTTGTRTTTAPSFSTFTAPHRSSHATSTSSLHTNKPNQNLNGAKSTKKSSSTTSSSTTTTTRTTSGSSTSEPSRQQQRQQQQQEPRARATSGSPIKDEINSNSNSNNNNNNHNNHDYNKNRNPFPPTGDWEELYGNYLLRPSPDEAPRALIHFLGGALVGATPHITYRYLLERLAAKGFLIVATPFSLSFDRLETCDAILNRFERVAIPLARTYGALPVIGVGHSAGALLQVLITSLFPDTPRAANALISYNSLQVTEAVPLFEELITPFFTYVAARNETNLRRNGAQVISTVIELAQAQVCGEVPSDDLLQRAVRLLLIPPSLENDATVDWLHKNLVIPQALREAMTTATQTSPLLSLSSQAGVAPVMYDLLEALQQIPALIEEVADGAREFVPLPAQVQTAARRAYRARNTLVLQYEDDTLDESPEIEALLQAAGQVIRMKRPMVDIQVQRRTIADAGHAAPLLAPPSLAVATRAEDLLRPEVARDQFQYVKAHETVEELIQWLEASNL